MAIFEDFRYERAIGAPDAADHALVFATRVGDRELEGCDFLHENADGQIDEFVVMVRPLTGALALAEAHARPLRGRRRPGPLGQRPVVHRLVRVHVLAVEHGHPAQRLEPVQPLALVEAVEGARPARRRRSASSRSGARSRPSSRSRSAASMPARASPSCGRRQQPAQHQLADRHLADARPVEPRVDAVARRRRGSSPRPPRTTCATRAAAPPPPAPAPARSRRRRWRRCRPRSARTAAAGSPRAGAAGRRTTS